MAYRDPIFANGKHVNARMITTSIRGLCRQLKHCTPEERVDFLRDNGEQMVKVFANAHGDENILGAMKKFGINANRFEEEVTNALAAAPVPEV